MVSITTSTIGVVTALQAITCIHAASYSENPTTLSVGPLGPDHPAYGAQLPENSPAYNIYTPSENREINFNYVNLDFQKIETYLGGPLERNYNKLAKVTQAAIQPAPWPSSYWPHCEDGINAQWFPGAKPASEKYALAYGLNVKDFSFRVSNATGILSQVNMRRPTCTDDSQCPEGSACSTRPELTKGLCIPKWFGICHAWCPAALLEREPQCSVIKNGITFEPLDIKGLVSQFYDGAKLKTVVGGARFRGPDDPASLDADGRYTDYTRRDVGPGFFHVVVHNLLGINKQSFIIDMTAGAEVWNQPVRSYKVLQTQRMEPSAAAQTYFNKDVYTFNSAAVSIVYVKLQFSWVVEAIANMPLVSTGEVDKHTVTAHYEYLLELDSDDNIIGGEWVSGSRYEHPDFLWFPSSRPSMDTVTDIGIRYRDIRELLDHSADCIAIPSSTVSS